MTLFYIPNFGIQSPFLNEEESHHAIKVLRLQKTDKVNLTDGLGNWYLAEIYNPNPKACEVKILQHISEYQKRMTQIHIAIAPTKNIERIEWFIEKSVEIGIDEISFLRCEHSERKQIKLERLEKIAISAMKQSLKAYLPKVNDLINFDTFVLQNNHHQQKFIAHLEEDNPRPLRNVLNPNSNYCILIGPEGDFSPKEIELAKQHGFQIVSLGNSRLRTETAGLVACHICNLLGENQ